MTLVTMFAVPLLLAPPAVARGPVVVELFTSQGCSSCPAADEILSKLGNGEGVLPLAFHVDYWNSIGWADPFSTSEWSERQRSYAAALGGGSYTPEAVVDGRTALVGSREGALSRAVSSARETPAAWAVTLAATRSGTSLRVKAGATPDAQARAGDLIAVLVERHRESRVTAGENSGRTLGADYAVRALVRIPTGAKAASLDRTITLDRAWKTGDLFVAAFVQQADMAITGSAPLTAPVAE